MLCFDVDINPDSLACRFVTITDVTCTSARLLKILLDKKPVPPCRKLAFDPGILFSVTHPSICGQFVMKC